MKLNKYTSGIIFIDDKEKEVESLMNYCKECGVNVFYSSPNDFIFDKLYYGYRIAFIDLAFDDGISDFKRAANIIRGISDNGEKHLLVVAWTQHEEDISKLKEEIEKRMSDNLPIAILNGQKSRLLFASTTEDFNELISQIFDDFLVSNLNLFNLLEWEESSLNAVREEFHNLIVKSYLKEIDPALVEKNMGLLARNTLLPYEVLSAFEILNNKVNDNVLNKISSMKSAKLDYDDSLFTFKEKFKFNYEMLFSKKENINNIPGSIYKKCDYSYKKIQNLVLWKKPDDLTRVEKLFVALEEKKIEFKSITHIIINCTPNCTFFQKKKNTTYFEGYIINDVKNYELSYNSLKELRGYSHKSEESCSYSYIDDSDIFSHMIICFDLCNFCLPKSSKKIAEFKNSIKVSIQQKYSSWVNRVGDNLSY